MAYFTHRFETVIALHPVATHSYTVLYLDPGIAKTLPFKEYPRLRIEADVSGIPLKGAWNPSALGWYLMLPKPALKQAGLNIGSPVEIAFKLIPQDDVELTPELAAIIKPASKLGRAWLLLSPGSQRGLAHWVAGAKRSDTIKQRLDQVAKVLLGQAELP
jgi:hypothetical protein